MRLQAEKRIASITLYQIIGGKDMKSQYQVIRQEAGELTEVVFTSTRKKETESYFRRLMKSFEKSGDYLVDRVRLGYAIVTTTSEYWTNSTEYFICKI